MAKETYPAGGRNRTPRVRRLVSEYGTAADRENRARATASKWRVLQKLGDGLDHYMETDNMEWALALAEVLIKQFRQGVIVQAIADDGATGAIPPEHFTLYRTAWRQRGATVSSEQASPSNREGGTRTGRLPPK